MTVELMEGTRASRADRKPFMLRKRLEPTATPCQGFVVNFSVRDADLHARRETTRVMPKRRRQRCSRSGSGVLARLGGTFLRP